MIRADYTGLIRCRPVTRLLRRRALGRTLTLLLSLALLALVAVRAESLIRASGQPSAWNEKRFFQWARAGWISPARKALAEVEEQLEPGEPVTLLVPARNLRDQRWWLAMALYHLPKQPFPTVAPHTTPASDISTAAAFRVMGDGRVQRVAHAPR